MAGGVCEWRLQSPIGQDESRELQAASARVTGGEGGLNARALSEFLQSMPRRRRSGLGLLDPS